LKKQFPFFQLDENYQPAFSGSLMNLRFWKPEEDYYKTHNNQTHKLANKKILSSSRGTMLCIRRTKDKGGNRFLSYFLFLVAWDLNSGSNACTTLATSLALTTGFLLEKSK
jgi:hypothetical protein